MFSKPKCPTCGSIVKIISGDEGTNYYEPIGEECAWAITNLKDIIEICDKLEIIGHQHIRVKATAILEWLLENG